MFSFNQLLPSGSKKPLDILAVHLGHAGTYCARLRKAGDAIVLAAADLLPPVAFQAGENAPATLSLPKPLLARYVALCVPGDDAVVKLLNLPGQLGDEPSEQIRESMGLGAAEFRIGYRVLQAGRHGRSETKVLTVAVPETQARAACALFRGGVPAPISVEVDGLAALTNFSLSASGKYADEAVACIVSDAKVSFAAFFLKGELLLIRKFDFGQFNLLSALHKNLGVDQTTARDILVNGSFDVSQMVKSAMEPFVKQLVISKHFIERRDNCHVARMFVAPEDWMARGWMAEVKSGVGVEIESWNPLEAVQVQEGALSKSLEPRSARLSAAIGAGLGLFAEDPQK